MKKILAILLVAIAPVIAFTSCSDDDDKVNVVLTADKTDIIANGTDKATFKVTVDGTEVTNATIHKMDEGGDLNGYSFTTEKAGTFGFYATYDGVNSGTFQIKARALTLAEQIEGTYDVDLDITVGDQDPIDGESKIKVTANEDGTVDFELGEFSIMGGEMVVNFVNVDDIEVDAKNGGAEITFDGKAKVGLNGSDAQEMDLTITGIIKDEVVDLDIVIKIMDGVEVKVKATTPVVEPTPGGE